MTTAKVEEAKKFIKERIDNLLRERFYNKGVYDKTYRVKAIVLEPIFQEAERKFGVSVVDDALRSLNQEGYLGPMVGGDYAITPVP